MTKFLNFTDGFAKGCMKKGFTGCRKRRPDNLKGNEIFVDDAIQTDKGKKTIQVAPQLVTVKVVPEKGKQVEFKAAVNILF